MNLIPRFLSFQQDGGDSSILFSLLATTFNNTLNSTANCHPLLFTTGLSREETPTIENSICPDTYGMFTTSFLYLYFLTFGVMSSSLHQHLRDVHPTFESLTPPQSPSPSHSSFSSIIFFFLSFPLLVSSGKDIPNMSKPETSFTCFSLSVPVSSLLPSFV